MSKRVGHKRPVDLHLTPSKLRKLTARDLRKMDSAQFIVSREHDTLAVLIPYGNWYEVMRRLKMLEEAR